MIHCSNVTHRVEMKNALPPVFSSLLHSSFMKTFVFSLFCFFVGGRDDRFCVCIQQCAILISSHDNACDWSLRFHQFSFLYIHEGENVIIYIFHSLVDVQRSSFVAFVFLKKKELFFVYVCIKFVVNFSPFVR